MRVLVTGATGFIGSRLVHRLEQAVVLSRDAEGAKSQLAPARVRAYDWNPVSGPPPVEAFDQVDAVVHLAGESVAGRWTSGKKKRIRESRLLGTRHLVEGLRLAAQRPQVLVCASAVGYYGSRGDEILDENSAAATDDFLAQVCQEWEQESEAARKSGLRVVHPRIGIVLGANGGALQPMLRLFKLGAGGRVGSGRQWWPWIHVDDLVRLLIFACEQTTMDGPVNAVAPHPVTNEQFTKTLGHVLHRPTILPAPGFGLKLALGEFAEVLLASQRAVPRVAQQAGFAFEHPELEEALRSIIA